jgi:hypothetical protein
VISKNSEMVRRQDTVMNLGDKLYTLLDGIIIRLTLQRSPRTNKKAAPTRPFATRAVLLHSEVVKSEVLASKYQVECTSTSRGSTSS